MYPKVKPFKEEVKENLQNFMQNCESHVERQVNINQNGIWMNHTRKLAKYLHNVISRRTGMESNVHRFGSRMIGCATKSSDLDLLVQVENRKNKSDVEILEQIKSALTDCNIWKVKILIRKTLVPILRVQFTPLNLDLDIVASNHIGVFDSKIMKHMLSFQPDNAAQKLFFFLLKWIKDINAIPIKKMVLFYLMIFYLQKKSYLPSLKDVHRNHGKKNCDVQFDSTRSMYDYNLKKMDNFQKEALNFFKFFATFRFDDYVIDMHSGKCIPRKKFQANETFKKEHKIWMTAPLDFNRNVARTGKDTLEKFQRVCHKSVRFLEEEWASGYGTNEE